MTNPKITVIIPTRERSDVLEHSLRTVTSQAYDNLEVIVSDNFSSDQTADVVRRANDHRIRYLNTGERLGMSLNWEFALSHVEDGWVAFMGDDDGLMPDAVQKIADVIRNSQAKVIRTDYCTYVWPGMTEFPNGQLIVPLSTGIEPRNSKEWLRTVLEGKARYNHLPVIYNGGFVHISLLRKIKERVGCFFSSLNPDVFTGVALARLTNDYLFIRKPLVISGTSRHSNGHSAFSKDEKRNRSAHNTFLGEPNIPFHGDLPLMPDRSFPLSLQACVYEVYLQSRALGGDIEGIDHHQQLIVTLATSGKHRKSIDSWGRLFAERHGLDYADACSKAAPLRILLRTRELSQKTWRAMHSVVTERPMLQNVHEASIAASVILSSPSRIDSARFITKQLVSAIAFRGA